MYYKKVTPPLANQIYQVEMKMKKKFSEKAN